MTRGYYFYLIRLRFLGFRYHGWQKQPGVKTVQLMVEKTIRFVVGEVKFKTLGASRTDAMVSAEDFPFELFIKESIDTDTFLKNFNDNLPSDIEAKSIEPVTAQFNVIQDVKFKTYQYNLCYGRSKNPFEAHTTAYVPKSLNGKVLLEAARELQGSHNFNAFTYPYEEGTEKMRVIDKVRVGMEQSKFTITFRSKGFMRYQIRLMVGALIEIASGKKNLEDLIRSLETGDDTIGYYKAPASGLTLMRVEY